MRSAGDHPRRNRVSTAEAVVLVLRLVVIVANMTELLDAGAPAVNGHADPTAFRPTATFLKYFANFDLSHF